MSEQHVIPAPLIACMEVPPALTDALIRVDRAASRYAAASDRGIILPNSVDAVRLELTYHSNAIEGSTLTLRETQLVLDGTSPANKLLREVYEARNHDRALRMIERWAQLRHGPFDLTLQDILDIHAAVMAELDDANAGRFRTERVLIRGTRFVPPGAQRFDTLFPALLSLANSKGRHPAIVAAELHYNFVAIHPFTDGNGRTARLLMNYYLLRNGFPLTVIPVERRSDYLLALEEANSSRWHAFAIFIASCIEGSVEHLLGKAEQ